MRPSYDYANTITGTEEPPHPGLVNALPPQIPPQTTHLLSCVPPGRLNRTPVPPNILGGPNTSGLAGGPKPDEPVNADANVVRILSAYRFFHLTRKYLWIDCLGRRRVRPTSMGVDQNWERISQEWSVHSRKSRHSIALSFPTYQPYGSLRKAVCMVLGMSNIAVAHLVTNPMAIESAVGGLVSRQTLWDAVW